MLHLSSGRYVKLAPITLEQAGTLLIARHAMSRKQSWAMIHTSLLSPNRAVEQELTVEHELTVKHELAQCGGAGAQCEPAGADTPVVGVAVTVAAEGKSG